MNLTAEHLEMLVQGSAALGLAWGTARWIGRPVVRCVRNARSLFLLVPTMRDDLAAVRAQIFPVGGPSLVELLRFVTTSTALTAQRLDFVLRFADLPIYETDADGAWNFANNALCELFGLSSHEMLGGGWLAAVHPEDRLLVNQGWQEMRARGIPYQASYRVVNCRTGETIDVVTRALAHRGADGKIIGYEGVVREASKDRIEIHMMGAGGAA